MPAPHWPAMTAFFLPRRSPPSSFAPVATRPRVPQRGAAALEFTLVMAVLLSVAALVVDAARWQVTRQVAHLALMEAARAGSTGHADPARIRDAFLRALRPLHAGPRGETAGRRLAHSQERIAARMGTVPWRIEILQPDAQAFHDHAAAGPGHAAPPGGRIIDNAYQALQHVRRPDLPASRDIFRANTLRLRLTYLYQPLLPPLRTLLAGLAESDGSYTAAARAQGLAPISIELEMEMHSNPADWLAGPPYPAGVVQGVCRSLRCP